MIVRNEKFISFIDEFTSSTYIMVICSNPNIEQEAIALNIKASKDYFESLMQSLEWVSEWLTQCKIHRNQISLSYAITYAF